MTDSWAAQASALGAFIRSQRELARLSLRQLAELTSLSHPYLSQVERGVHQPSVRVLKLISQALNLSAETILIQAGLLDEHGHDEPEQAGLTEQVTSLIRSDHRLTRAQQAALIAVYESMLELLARKVPSALPWCYRAPNGPTVLRRRARTSVPARCWHGDDPPRNRAEGTTAGASSDSPSPRRESRTFLSPRRRLAGLRSG